MDWTFDAPVFLLCNSLCTLYGLRCCCCLISICSYLQLTQHLDWLMLTDGSRIVWKRFGVRIVPLVHCWDPAHRTTHHFTLASLQMLKLHVRQDPAKSYRKTVNLVVCFPPARKKKWKLLCGVVWMLCLPHAIRWKRSTRFFVCVFVSILNLLSITKQQRNTGSEHLFQVWHHLEVRKVKHWRVLV